MKYITKLPAKIVAACIVGFLLAGAGTKITYSCAPINGAAGCAQYDKAVMHPADLLTNKQDSLVRFFGTFAITALASFAILSLLNTGNKKLKSVPHPKG